MALLSHILRFVSLISVTFLPGAALSAEELAKFREAWRTRFAEHKTISYQAAGVRSPPAAPDKAGATPKTSVRIDVRLSREFGRFRFHYHENGAAAPTILLFDGRQFHTCRLSGGDWDVTSKGTVAADSLWLEVYPFLLAHGAVPAPPFAGPQIAATNKQQPEDPATVRNAEATFTFGTMQPIAVTVAHNSDGVVARYLVTSGQRKVLEITNAYRRAGDAVRLDRYAVLLFSPDGVVARRLEGRVKEYRANTPLPRELFATPHSSRELREQLSASLEKKAKVELGMALDDLRDAIQATVGRDLQVRVDREAFENAPEARMEELRLEPGQASVSDILFYDLRKNHLDFVFDLQGVTIMPRRSAWARADLVEYSAAEYGLSLGEMRDVIAKAGTLDDWSDVGGPATMLFDEQQGRISVFHAQSDHFQFSRRLKNLEEEKQER